MREDLAAAYRLIAHFGLDDSIDTHISVRVPGTSDQFLTNPYGLLFREGPLSPAARLITSRMVGRDRSM